MLESNKKRMDDQFFNDLLRSDFRIYYRTRELNDILYIHYKGLSEIENLEEFTGLKCIYMEGNAFSKIQGFDKNINLRSLYLHENAIRKIENLEPLENLVSLNLGDNFIEKIENLGKNTQLETLQLKRNHLGSNGLDDLIQLKDLKSIRVLDISNNRIDFEKEEDIEEFLNVLEGMDNLAVLYLMQNKVCRKIRHYRKTLINRLKNLKYLDDRPVFPEDRRYAEAFARGGLKAEREERKKFKEEKEAERIRNHEAFKQMIAEGKAEREKKKAEKQEESESEDTQNLETYYSDSNKHTSEISASKKEDISENESEDDDSISQKSESKDGSIKSDKIGAGDSIDGDEGLNDNNSEGREVPDAEEIPDQIDIEFDAFLTELD